MSLYEGLLFLSFTVCRAFVLVLSAGVKVLSLLRCTWSWTVVHWPPTLKQSMKLLRFLFPFDFSTLLIENLTYLFWNHSPRSGCQLRACFSAGRWSLSSLRDSPVASSYFQLPAHTLQAHFLLLTGLEPSTLPLLLQCLDSQLRQYPFCLPG